jgi:hypothetical protein
MRQEIKDLAQDYEYTNGTYGFIKGVKHQEKQNDSFAIKFAEWYLNLWLTDDDSSFDNNSPEELLEIFKKEIYDDTI